MKIGLGRREKGRLGGRESSQRKGAVRKRGQLYSKQENIKRIGGIGAESHLGSDLVAALAGLDVHDLPHVGGGVLVDVKKNQRSAGRRVRSLASSPAE